MAQRVAILLDYQNVHLVGHHHYGRDRRLIQCVPNPVRLAGLIASRSHRPSEAAGIRVYRGRPNPDHQPLLAATNDAQSDEWSKDSRVQVIRRQLNYRGWPDQPPQEKGIDVAIEVDLMRLAFQREYEALVLFSSDSDLLPALETIVELRLGRVEVACWKKAKRLRLPGAVLPYCHFLDRADWEAVVEDWKGRA
jgi:uncharacterized LabA/DUF88 family protein